MMSAATQYPVPTAMICSDIALGWQSCMNLTTEISPIEEAARMRRTWNGTAINLARPAFQLLRVTLTCEGDMVSPALAHMWPGKRFQLIPAEELSEPTWEPQQRTAYPGSMRILDQHFQPASSGRRFYRPVLDLVVWDPWFISGREADKVVSWSLPAQEYAPPASED